MVAHLKLFNLKLTINIKIMRAKIMEPITLLGTKRFANLDIRVRVRGGGYTS